MKKTIYTVFAFAVFAASALANQVTELDVKVPFAFTAGKATLPAGTYSLTEAGESYVLIRGEKGGVFVPKSMIGLALDESGKVSLKFNRAGDKYVLQSAKAER